jgi:hypothetical protein
MDVVHWATSIGIPASIGDVNAIAATIARYA